MIARLMKKKRLVYNFYIDLLSDEIRKKKILKLSVVMYLA